MMSELASVTRWLYYYSVFGHYINDYLPTSIKTPNLVQKFAKYEKATQKNSQRLFKFCHSDEILPNLVTLEPAFKMSKLQFLRKTILKNVCLLKYPILAVLALG